MKKQKIDTTAISSELQGSVFFRGQGSTTPADREETPAGSDTTTSGRHEVQTPRRRSAAPPRHPDAATPRPPNGSAQRDRVAVIGDAVSELGTKRTTIRFSRPEKSALREIIYAYERREIRTGENELTRIALNWLVEDYREHGEGSVLARVVARLHDQQGGG
jgi:hypothetical protein